MQNGFFLPSISDEHELYRRLRDNPAGAISKREFEKLWQIFSKYAPTGFQKKAQRELYQCWWEMYLSVGLLNLNLPIMLSSKNKGPDIKILIGNNKTLWIEAVAPKEGDGKSKDKLPQLSPTSELTVFSFDLPEVDRKFLLRFTGAISQKNGYTNNENKDIEGLKKYHQDNIVSKNDIYIIALSSCEFDPFYSSVASSLAPAPLKMLAGVGSATNNGYHIERKSINKSNGSEIHTNLFYNKEYEYISAILYSDSMILGSDEHQYDKPEVNFKLFSNPNAINPVPVDLFKGIELWGEDSVTETTKIWKKIKYLK